MYATELRKPWIADAGYYQWPKSMRVTSHITGWLAKALSSSTRITAMIFVFIKSLMKQQSCLKH